MGIHMHAAAWWGMNSAISGRHIAAVFGVINSMGALGGAVSQVVFGSLPRTSWDQAFYVAAGLLLLGALCWSQVDARRVIIKATT
jgi:nitrate/nitrite transporter NarK